MSRRLLPAALLLLAPALTAQFTPKYPPYEQHTLPVAFHVGSHGATEGARFATADGALDTGAGVLRFVDGRTGEPLPVRQPDYGHGPTLYLRYDSALDGLDVGAVVVAQPILASGDRRLVAATQLRLGNGGEEARSVRLSAVLSPGGDGAAPRPYGALAFDPSATFSVEDSVITRDGHTLLGWVGSEPAVEVVPHAAGPDEVVATLTWELTVPPGEARFVELKFAGPPASSASNGAAGSLDETAFRNAFRRSSYARQEETLRWEWQFRGRFSDMDMASRSLWHALVGGVHVLRMFGDARTDVTALSDRPYGHPASDAAVEAEIAAILLEWGFDAITVPYHERLIEELNERTAGLPPERQLAYVHGLARGQRLLQAGPQDFTLANAILVFASQPLPVGAWHDPQEVREDLAAILERAGIGDASMLPELQWDGAVPEASVAGRMQAVRRALAEGRRVQAWEGLTGLLALATPSGAGSLEEGGEPDGAFSMGVLTLARRFFFDDHGEDLVLAPGCAYGLFRYGQDLRLAELPTRFGGVRLQVFHTSPNVFGAWFLYFPAMPPRRTLLQLPEGVRVVPDKFTIGGGTAEPFEGDPNLLAIEDDPELPGGVRFTVRVRGAP